MEAEGSATPRARTPRIVLRVADPHKFRTQYLPDLADGGLFVRTDKLLAAGTAVEVELHPPGWDEPLALRGRVNRRVEPGAAATPGMHVAFEALDSALGKRLLELVAAFGGPVEGGAAGREAPEAAAARAPVLEPWASAPEPAPGARPQVPNHPVPVAADRDDGFRELAELRGRLAAAEATIAALRQELAAHEEDEAGTRALAERLAIQKNRLDRLRKKEAEEAAAEFERFRRELEGRAALVHDLESRATLAEARAEMEREARAEAEVRAEQDRQARTEAEASAAEWKGRAVEAEGKVRELSARVEEAERMALDAEERVEQLSARIREAEDELSRARTDGAEHARNAAALARDLETASEERRQAELQLEELQVRLQAEEEAHRAAVARGEEFEARLAALQEAHAADRERLLAELAATAARVKEAETARGRAEEQVREVEERLGESRARVAELEARHAAAEERLGRLRTKEKDLRRLLAVLSAKVAEETDEEGTEPVDPGPAAADADEAAEPGALAETAPAAGDRPLDDTVAARDAAVDSGGIVIAAELLAEAGLAGAPVAETDIPVDMDLDEAPPGGVDFDQFVERLAAGNRVRRTEAFRRYRPAEPSEIRLGGWLVQADSLEALRELAGGKLAGDRLPRLLFDFYRRGLLDLVD